MNLGVNGGRLSCDDASAAFFSRLERGQLMKRLLMAAIALLLSHQATHAADISVVAEEAPSHPALHLDKGDVP
jgi:hypothetical protein